MRAGLGLDFIHSAKHILENRATATVEGHGMSPAAVLLALYAVDGELRIVLQKRSERVEHHKGEISFPGGMVDRDDESLLATALREADEEMGIRPSDVEALGRLDDTPTISDFMISTFVGAIPSPYTFTPSEAEVAEVLLVPVSHLRKPSSYRDDVRLEDGEFHRMPIYVYDGHVIFGATARILEQFLTLTKDAPL